VLVSEVDEPSRAWPTVPPSDKALLADDDVPLADELAAPDTTPSPDASPSPPAAKGTASAAVSELAADAAWSWAAWAVPLVSTDAEDASGAESTSAAVCAAVAVGELSAAAEAFPASPTGEDDVATKVFESAPDVESNEPGEEDETSVAAVSSPPATVPLGLEAEGTSVTGVSVVGMTVAPVIGLFVTASVACGKLADVADVLVELVASALTFPRSLGALDDELEPEASVLVVLNVAESVDAEALSVFEVSDTESAVAVPEETFPCSPALSVVVAAGAESVLAG
jgi:hypothetical protein